MQVRRTELVDIVRDGAYRLEGARERFRSTFDREPTVAVSAPGRTEIIGNHTDHNRGRVVSAAIDLDTLVLAAPAPEERSRLVSTGWDETFSMAPSATVAADSHDTERLMRGVAAGFTERNYAAPCYDAVLDSRVLPGSGLSSSAALEMSLAGIHEALSGTEVDPVERARIGQYAENSFMDKPSGMMDQMAVSIGGTVAIDFIDPAAPRYHQIELDFQRFNHQLLTINTGGSHADLTGHYAAIPREMNAVAAVLGHTALGESSRSELFARLNDVRTAVGDRGVLRSCHFFDEQSRVMDLIDAVDSRVYDRVLHLMNESGRSSWMLLQNIYAENDGHDEALALALTLTTEYFRERGATGACRVHGGGFAGTILVAVPLDLVPEYRTAMSRAFGKSAVQEMTIRPEGVVYCTL